MKDRFTKGFIAGIAGWFPQFVFTTTMYYAFHLVKLRYLDFSAILGYGHKPQNWLQTIFAELIVVGFLGVLGAIFALVIKVIRSTNIMLKGALFGAGVWFLIFATTYVSKVEGLYKYINFPTAVINFSGAAIWGISTSLVFLFLNKRYSTKTLLNKCQHQTNPQKYSFTPSPARKHDGEIKSVRLRKPLKIKKD